MTPAEAHAAAAAKGLRLVCAENATGFKGVSFSTTVSKPKRSLSCTPIMKKSHAVIAS